MERPPCFYCGDPATQNDHVKPRSRFGRVGLQVPACRPCNSSKGARTPIEWLVALCRFEDHRYSRTKRIIARSIQGGLLTKEEFVEALRLDIGLQVTEATASLVSLIHNAPCLIHDLTGAESSVADFEVFASWGAEPDEEWGRVVFLDLGIGGEG